MELGVVLDMVASADPERVAVVGPTGASMTTGDLATAAHAAAERFLSAGATRVGYLAPSDLALPVALFGAALAGIPFCPLNFRLADAQLLPLVTSEPNTLIVVGDHERQRLVESVDNALLGIDELLSTGVASDESVALPVVDDDAIAVVLYTSGTTSEPKAAMLRHRHLTSYLLAGVEFASATPDDTVLVSVPPYHIAGVATILSNLFAGRRIVYLDPFDATRWLEVVRDRNVTHAMVVPTMLARIVDELAGRPAAVPSLRSLAYGGAPMPPSVITAALGAFDGVDFVNAYGLTETSSTITVLDGDDHRAALTSADPAVRARLGSAGRPVPGLELAIRREDGSACAQGESGAVFVRGDQVSGEYLNSQGPDDGWFATRDIGHVDDDGYLFIEGRADDTIIRGGENISPAEIEHVLLDHPGVADCAVVGLPDPEWGQRIGAAIVARRPGTLDVAELTEWSRQRLRTAKTPDVIVVRDELPRTETGKVMRRKVLADFDTIEEG